MNKNHNTGFSFIEILIVLAIVAGIATLVLQQSDTAVDRSLVQKFYVDIDELRTAAAQFKVQTGSYSGMTMVSLHEAGLLPDRFAYDDDGYPRVNAGEADDESQESSPIGGYWGIWAYGGGQSYVLATPLYQLGDAATQVAVARQLSRHIDGQSGNCAGMVMDGHIVPGVQSCRGVGQAWPDNITTWHYLVQD